MRKILKSFGVLPLLGMALAFGATSCSNDDPDYDTVTPPDVDLIHSISGKITEVSGDELAGVTVSLSSENGAELDKITSSEDGTFVIHGVEAGTYTLRAETDGKTPVQSVMKVEDTGDDGHCYVWNVVMFNQGEELMVDADKGSRASLTSETLDGNEAAEVDVELVVPAGAVEDDCKIIVTPVYTSAHTGMLDTRSGESVMLIGADVRADDESIGLLNPVELRFDIAPEMTSAVTAKKYLNGKWMEASFETDGDVVTVSADEFATYSLFFNAEVSSSSSSVDLAFSQTQWDNLYGGSDLSVTSVEYTYSMGGEIETSVSDDPVLSYLIELVGRQLAGNATGKTATYPLDVKLPVGTAMTIKGKQQITRFTVSAQGKSASGVSYGNVSISADTYNRAHTGGSGGSAN